MRFRSNRLWFGIFALCIIALLAPSASAIPAHAELTPSLGQTADHQHVIHLQLTVDDGFHVQSHTPLDKYLLPLTVTMQPCDGITFGDVQYPKPSLENYPALGQVSVYTGSVQIDVPFQGNAAIGKLSGVLRIQACDSDSCFPPQKLPFEVAIASTTTTSTTTLPSTQAAATLPTTQATAAASEAQPPAPNQIFGQNLNHNAYLLAFGAAFVVGLIFNVMPCVLPVVPLKIMGFYEVSQHDRRKSVLLGSVFSAGLIFSFALLGVLIVVLHVIDWGGLFKHTWFTAVIVIVLLSMAVSTFGFFTVSLPGSMYQFTPRHDTYSGNFLFGMLTAALSTPCTFGMFVFLLTWAIAQPALIGLALFIMVGIGMATPYFILSAIPEVARNLPRTGPWAETVKQLMGFLLLGTAVYFAQPLFGHLLSQSMFWWLLYAIVVAASLYLALRSFQHATSSRGRVIGVTIAIVLALPTFFVTQVLAARPYEWEPFSQQALADGQSANRPVLIDFTASWCGNCHYLEGFVLHDKRIVTAVRDRNILMLQADVTNGTEAGQPLLDRLNPIGSVPVTAVYLAGSKEPRVLKDIYTADDLLGALK